MQSGEHDPSVSDRPDQPALIERVYAERAEYSSTIEYVNALITHYSSAPEHKANLLQMERLSRTIFDPRNTGEEIEHSMDAFFWGQVLGYAAGQHYTDEPIHEDYWKYVSGDLQKRYRESKEDAAPNSDQALTLMGLTMQGELELADEEIPTELEAFIDSHAPEIHREQFLQDYIKFGFRYSTLIALRYGVFSSVMKNGGIERLNSGRYEDSEVVHQGIMNIVYAAMEEHDFTEAPESKETYERNLKLLTNTVNQELKAPFETSAGQEYRFSGAVMAMVENYEDPSASTTFLVTDGAYIEASYESIRVTEGPTEAAVEHFDRMGMIDPSILKDCATPYCVVMEVSNPVIQEPDGTVHQLQEYERLSIVLSNDYLHLHRFVIQ